MKKTHIIILIFIAVAIAVLISFMGDLTTYDTVASARQKEGKFVHLIAKLDKQNQKLGVLKTREEQARSTAISVRLRRMRSYTQTINIFIADGVTDGRPAARAGLKAGDVITQIGDHKVSSVESYMQALGKFNKGEKTVVKFKRGNTDMQAVVQF